MKTYLIKEIFGPTIQGEGHLVGTQVLFLRFSGCNRWSGDPATREKSVCSFCDTDFWKGTKMTKSEIIDRLIVLSKNGHENVVVSGGEPTLQIDKSLLRELADVYEFKLHLETNGSKDIGDLDQYFETISVSPKQSREETLFGDGDVDSLKILYPWVTPDVTPEEFEFYICRNRYIQPIEGPDWSANMTGALAWLKEHPSWKLSAQLHKFIGAK